MALPCVHGNRAAAPEETQAWRRASTTPVKARFARLQQHRWALIEGPGHNLRERTFAPRRRAAAVDDVVMGRSITPSDTTRRFPVWVAILLAGCTAILIIGAFFVARSMYWGLRPTPEFASLVTDPDPSLVGTVVFLKPYPDECVYAVPASGGEARQIACLEGGPGGLRWLPDGRVQSTRYQGGEGTPPTASWIIDVETGAVTEVPDSEIPPQPEDAAGPAPGPNGEVVACESARGTLTLTMGDRILLDVGAPETYCMGGPAWNGDGSWFVVKDDLDRLLLVTTAEPSQTRVLVESGWGQIVTDGELRQ